MITLISSERLEEAVLVDRTGRVVRRFLPNLVVVHLQLAGDHLLAGTWGKGLRRLPLGEIAP